MKTINILHISDAHIQKKDESEIKEIAEKLISDVVKVQNIEKIKVDLVCFTGDLIQRGDKAQNDENQWQIAMAILVNPLLNALNLSIDNFICIPGNHEVNINGIVKATENGLNVKSLTDINDIMTEFDASYSKRLEYFYKIVSEMYSDVKFGTLGYTFNREINGIKLGIVCLDSAWRSSGKGVVEKGNLYVGIKQIEELYLNIKNADVKICMMHHPLDWLEDCETLEIEKRLTNFDIVLRGHVHDEDDKQIIRQNLKTIYNTAGKLYPLDFAEGRAIDGYNGYSILNIDLNNNICNIFLRTYYGNSRSQFDIATNICEAGKKVYALNYNIKDKQLEFSIIKGISHYFHNMSEKYTLIKNADTQSPNNIRKTLVEPVLADNSEYVKENEGTEEINIIKIVESIENIILIGKKESGKTTILQQIGLRYIDEHEFRGVLPIYINMKYLLRGTDKLLSSAICFVMNNILDEISTNKREIKEMISNGQIVFLIDNVNTNNAEHTILLSKFIKEYSNNRFILTIEEEFFQSIELKQIPNYENCFREIYIQNMGKAQIREMVTRWTEEKDNVMDITNIVNRIDSYCNQINFAKTPFNIAIFMIIWDTDNNFIPLNEGIVMENYLQIVLEKLAPKESYRSTYSFTIKQNFLSYLAHEMYLKDEYFFTDDEFKLLLSTYHNQKGFKISESKFDIIFLEKNILSYSDGFIVFSHTSFLEYFLAIYATNNKEFLNEITSKGNRINFRNEICFYSGLNQNCIELLDNLSDTILSGIIENFELITELNNVEIIADFEMDKSQILEDIQRNRLSQNELDDLSDRKYEEKKPTDIVKKDAIKNDAEDFYSLLQMYGSVIKNAELLDNNLKIMHLEYYMHGMNMLYAIMVKILRSIEFDTLDENDKKRLNVYTEDEFEKVKFEMVDFSKLIFPIAIQNLILESVGTPKLELAINELLKTKKDKAFEKFMLAFLKCDLKMANLKNELESYIKREESKGILKLIFMKLTFYYRARFFGYNPRIDKEILNLLTEVHMKLNPMKKQNFGKSLITQQLKLQLDKT